MLVNTSELVILTGARGNSVTAKLGKSAFKRLYAALDAPGANHTEIAKEFAIDRGTLYNYIRRREEIEVQL